MTLDIHKCSKCKKYFLSREALRLHAVVHRKDRPVKKVVWSKPLKGRKGKRKKAKGKTQYSVTNIANPWQGGLPGMGKRR